MRSLSLLLTLAFLYQGTDIYAYQDAQGWWRVTYSVVV